ncbi:CRISPR-associated helicase Cas3' [Polluticaenibacter yanchengensis]|uniref:CRISPR-associated helicase Cas3 n=1 Tax=Polluticaenibacter yanchengensis TaxID=3014562 RepID=A0ABT4UPH0_9BACT|nr:CRISPR-associated helicase Cas3' [Chitinophagaceae bacterium LY-5]
MLSYFKSAREIIKELPALSDYLNAAGNYYAHLPKSDLTIPKETLEEHINLVNNYAVRLIEKHRLDDVINNMIADYVVTNDEKISNYLKKLFINTIVFHDFGKINEHFQVDKMKNNSFKDRTVLNSPIGSTHSALGAYIYLTKHLNEIGSEYNWNQRLLTACIYLSYSIFKHHGSRFTDESLGTTNFDEFQAKYKFEDVANFLSNYLVHFGFQVNPNILKMIGKNEWLRSSLRLVESTTFSLYALCRLNFSLLTASDYLATNEYMNQAPLTDFGTLSLARINEIYKQVTEAEWINEAEGKRNYNKAVFEKTEDYQLQYPTDATSDNLNILRTEMAVEVIRNIRKNSDQNLFYIEAPTGGGKTNLSALAALELLKLHQRKYNKVFYVFPFTTLITQTYKSLKETLFLHDDEMVELHSNAGMKVKENKEDDKYGEDKLNYINNLFVNYPFAFLSHIRFFDILKTNEKEPNYLLHRIANSIVVIDELQSYSPQHWDKVIYFIQQYADKFNIKFILMSATLPKLDKLDVIKDRVQNFVYLLPDAKKNYFNNPNFAGRVTFNFDLFESSDLQLSEIASKLLAESENYAQKDFGNAKPLGSVYTIIEFIFKKTATEFYELINQSDFFDEILLLSGTILPHRRKEIINFLKNKSNRQKKVLLVTTQVVEAGVDIDMDLGFKDRSLIDSDEQLAGRINRNVNKEDCTLFLFNYNKETIIYGKDKRLKLTRDHINLEQYQSILKNKDFDKLYDLVLNDRNEWNKKDMVIGFREYEDKIKSLKYQSVHEEFKLIDQHNLSCFVPLAVPITVDGAVVGKRDEVFTNAELTFLKEYHVYANENNKVEGSEVFDIFLRLIHSNRECKKEDFAKSKTDDKILQSIMSKYVFSLFATDKVERKINDFIGDPEKSQYGYKYMTEWKMFYAIDTGMRDSDFNSNETQFL